MKNDSLAPARLQDDELLLLPAYVLLADGPQRDHAVVVSNGTFTAVGPADEVIARHPHLNPLALPEKLVMPGFVDAHHHLTQSFGKALAFGEPSEIYRRIWVPLENCLDENLVYLSAKLAALEALRGGFTTVCDAGTRAAGDASTIAAATQEIGVRCVLGLICNDLADDIDARARAAIVVRAQQHLARWEGHALVHPSLAVSVPEAGSDGMLQTAAALCADAGAVFQTHANEHLAAVERSIVRRKMRPIEHLHYAGALGPQTLIAHATLVTPSELNLLAGTGAAVSYNPVASSWKGNAVAPALQMAALGIRFGLGTDGTRSDAFRLIDAAETAQRFAFGLATGDSSCGGGELWLDRALRGGANALRLDARIGEIAPGKAADFLLVDLDVPEMRPSWDLTWELVRLANRSQIDAVFVAGKLRLWQGWPLDWDARAFLREVDAIASEVVARAPIQRVHSAPRVHDAASETFLPIA
ncbi:hydroxydechloroatrazine ethylaminohydrolase [Caballeronia novacaledonica]|uniref:Hydroxydechloroatrazine ethylaminohydrolase n=1 Tax=Caballeronia novacaledonica TaxID=1544861 RepID=A0A2U3ICS3_9BURK|nr:amidohydrolase family protein [Caballeronia novacaledonica]SPB18024.1 hydroxydechloroatrazine ethylaminohydrolase [Caballeronia novacaledonica]